MLYLGIFILPTSRKIKFHGDRLSQNSIWTNLDPKSSIFNFFPILFSEVFFHFLAHWLEMWFFANAIPSPMSLPYISLSRPTSLTCFQGTKWNQDNMEPGQNGTRTIWIWDNLDPGQYGSGTIWIQDMDPGQNGSRTRWIQDNMDLGQSGSRTIWIQDNRDP